MYIDILYDDHFLLSLSNRIIFKGMYYCIYFMDVHMFVEQSKKTTSQLFLENPWYCEHGHNLSRTDFTIFDPLRRSP